MKVILECEIPDEILKREGVEIEQLVAAYSELGKEMRETGPEGISITMRIVASDGRELHVQQTTDRTPC